MRNVGMVVFDPVIDDDDADPAAGHALLHDLQQVHGVVGRGGYASQPAAPLTLPQQRSLGLHAVSDTDTHTERPAGGTGLCRWRADVDDSVRRRRLLRVRPGCPLSLLLFAVRP